MLNRQRFDGVLARFSGKRILVFGDIVLDRYIFGEVERISPEAPVPVLKVRNEEFRLGGAGNVAINIDRLGGRGILLGVTGDDLYADEIAGLKGIDHVICRDRHWRTIVKTRVIAQRQQIVRIDREETLRPERIVEQRLIREARRIGVDGIVISDYGKGTVTPTIMECLKERAAAEKIPLVVDPKPPHFGLYSGVTGITPNLKEAEDMVGRRLETDADIARAVSEIRRRFSAEFVVITRGRQGLSAGERGKRVFHLPALSHEVFDVTGAGDTVAAVLSLALVAGGTLVEAAVLANLAASVVVEKIGTSSVTPGELREKLAVYHSAP